MAEEQSQYRIGGSQGGRFYTWMRFVDSDMEPKPEYTIVTLFNHNIASDRGNWQLAIGDVIDMAYEQPPESYGCDYDCNKRLYEHELYVVLALALGS